MKRIMQQANQFLGNGIRFIEGELFKFVKNGGVGDDHDIESVGDGCR